MRNCTDFLLSDAQITPSQVSNRILYMSTVTNGLSTDIAGKSCSTIISHVLIHSLQALTDTDGTLYSCGLVSTAQENQSTSQRLSWMTSSWPSSLPLKMKQSEPNRSHVVPSHRGSQERVQHDGIVIEIDYTITDISPFFTPRYHEEGAKARDQP
jgi:hypothetical protein